MGILEEMDKRIADLEALAEALQKRLADRLGVEMGTYTHRASSFHCYEKDLGMLQGYVERINEGDEDEVTYEYEGGWAELMEMAKPEIAAAVEELRNR